MSPSPPTPEQPRLHAELPPPQRAAQPGIRSLSPLQQGALATWTAVAVPALITLDKPILPSLRTLWTKTWISISFGIPVMRPVFILLKGREISVSALQQNLMRNDEIR